MSRQRRRGPGLKPDLFRGTRSGLEGGAYHSAWAISAVLATPRSKGHRKSKTERLHPFFEGCGTRKSNHAAGMTVPISPTLKKRGWGTRNCNGDTEGPDTRKGNDERHRVQFRCFLALPMGGKQKHFVAVVGGAISGSVAAEILADHGVRVAVIEQNARPYGKIEDGLPRWHVEQRRQEYGRIDARLKKANVYFVPSTKLGRDLDFRRILPTTGDFRR